jgi:hypothetical protein
MGQYQGETGAWEQTEDQAITKSYWLKLATHEAKCDTASIIGCAGLAAARGEVIVGRRHAGRGWQDHDPDKSKIYHTSSRSHESGCRLNT